MSIFSRILKRGPEDAGEKPADATGKPADATGKPAPAGKPTHAAKPGAAPREGASPVRPQPAAAASRPATPSSGPRAVAASPNPSLGVTRYYQAAAKPAPAAATGAAPGRAPARRTPARGVAPVSAPAPKVVASPAPARSGTTAPAASAADAPARAAAVMAVVAELHADDDGAPAEALSAAGSLDQVFEQLFKSDAAPAPAGAGGVSATMEGRSTTGDQRTLMATFEELAVGHTAQVRSFMLEVRWGEAQTSWLELARPALRSLCAMAKQVEHEALVSALDGFEKVVRDTLRPGAPPAIGAKGRDALLAAYLPLYAAMPRAFELDGERDRREPIVVRALLEQVTGLDALMIDRMMAAGLGRLEALLGAKADEIAVVSDVPDAIAEATAARVQAFRRATPATLSAPDPAATSRELAGLIAALEQEHQAFEDVSRGWSSDDREAKKRLRRAREVSFLQIVITLARLGEVDLVLELQKLPFARRIEELARLGSQIAAAAASAPQSGPTSVATSAAPDYDQLEIERRMDSGAHPAP